MEIFRFKKGEFNLENFIHYYNDNVKELLMEFPHYISRICLVDRDYMDVIAFDEDYEDLNDEKDYERILFDGDYNLHFAVGKTYENAEKIELIDGEKFSLNHYMEDIYEEEDAVKDIGDLSLNMDNLIGFLFELEEETDEIVVFTVDFEHGGEISTPRIRIVDDCGDLEEILKNILERFIVS
ncbi:hypothetical protein [Terrisporobacter sp.]